MATVTDRAQSAQIRLRTTPHLKSVIERAASIVGVSVSSFVLQQSYEAAASVVSGERSLVSLRHAFQSFVLACDKSGVRASALPNPKGFR